MSTEYVEQREGAYRVAGTRVSLDSIVFAFTSGQFDAQQLDYETKREAARAADQGLYQKAVDAKRQTPLDR